MGAADVGAAFDMSCLSSYRGKMEADGPELKKKREGQRWRRVWCYLCGLINIQTQPSPALRYAMLPTASV